MKKKVTQKMVERMRELRARGMSYRTIGSKLGLNPMTVYNYLKREEAKPEEKPKEEKAEEKKEEGKRRPGLVGRLKRAFGLR